MLFIPNILYVASQLEQKDKEFKSLKERNRAFFEMTLRSLKAALDFWPIDQDNMGAAGSYISGNLMLTLLITFHLLKPT